MRALGKNRKDRLMIYTVSSCTLCKKAMAILRRNSVEYEYMDIDRSEPEERKEAMLDICDYQPRTRDDVDIPAVEKL